MALRPCSRAPVIAPEPVAGRAAITRSAAGIGLYAGAIALRFGRSPLVVFLIAIAVTALTQLI
jgi:hypothetical protein